MTSNNIQKIMQNNLHLNPWMLSKNTNEIVNSYVQKIYKQMPQAFKKDPKPKVAAERPENKAPIRLFKAQQLEEYVPHKIVPQLVLNSAKKTSRTKVGNARKLCHDRLVQLLGANNSYNLQLKKKYSITTHNTAALLENRKFLKSPNLQIYSSRRYGSSASSSRSSLRRRHRHHQSPLKQVNNFLNSYHTGGGQLLDSFVKYLMPSRNQQMKGNLGSLPEALRISSTIQNELMTLDGITRNRIAMGSHKVKNLTELSFKASEPIEIDRLRLWKHPPPLEKFPLSGLRQIMDPLDKLKPCEQVPKKQLKPSSTMNLKPCEVPNWKEQHRLRRMKKLGLIEESPKNESVKLHFGDKIGKRASTENFINGKPFKASAEGEAYTKTSSEFNADTQRYFPNMIKADASMAEKSSCHKLWASQSRSKLSSKPDLCLSEVLLSPRSNKTSTLGENSNQGPLSLAAANIKTLMAKNPSIYRHGGASYDFSMGKY
ncbi:uncharacterized protein LOC106093953 [Stomoxys calcitrans]|uniref:uncharacterized protein LOC106093953 n=1 Tax=Stomoxys calcitrans TaxID=35570 RepID=UPI0027E298E9|nr:uncharacterized protein LOC106093953 [Stomoxys calcitrans]